MKKIFYFFLFKNIYLYTQSFGHAYCSFVNYPLKFLTGSQSVPKYQLVIRLYSPEVTNNIKFKTNTPSMKPKYSGTPGPRKARSFLRQYTLIGSRFIYLPQHGHLSPFSYKISLPTLTAFYSIKIYHI